jgi:hypothetical protein
VKFFIGKVPRQTRKINGRPGIWWNVRLTGRKVDWPAIELVVIEFAQDFLSGLRILKFKDSSGTVEGNGREGSGVPEDLADASFVTPDWKALHEKVRYPR